VSSVLFSKEFDYSIYFRDEGASLAPRHSAEQHLAEWILGTQHNDSQHKMGICDTLHN
jgi:hypothetical protein